MSDVEITGRCYCGDVRYRATASPRHPSTCYCEWCARTVGSTVTVWVQFPTDAFEFTHGEPTRFESSPGIIRTFCGRCGSSLSYHYKNGEQVDVTTATLDDPGAFPPTTDGPNRPPWLGRL